MKLKTTNQNAVSNFFDDFFSPYPFSIILIKILL